MHSDSLCMKQDTVSPCLCFYHLELYKIKCLIKSLNAHPSCNHWRATATKIVLKLRKLIERLCSSPFQKKGERRRDRSLPDSKSETLVRKTE